MPANAPQASRRLVLAPISPRACLSQSGPRGSSCLQPASSSHRPKAGLVCTAARYRVTLETVRQTETGMRIQYSALKVPKGLAENLEIALGDSVEGSGSTPSRASCPTVQTRWPSSAHSDQKGVLPDAHRRRRPHPEGRRASTR